MRKRRSLGWPYLSKGIRACEGMAYCSKSTDEELRQGCLAQHPLAQKYLYQRYFGRLLSITMRYTSDKAEATSVLNQAFLKIFTHLSQYNGRGSFLAWMSKIVLHASIDYVRSQAHYRRVMDFESPVEGYAFNEGLDQLHTEDILSLLQQLPPATRTVFCLYVVDGYKHAEIAQLLGIDEGTSKWHLFQARRQLQTLLKQTYRPTPDKPVDVSPL